MTNQDLDAAREAAWLGWWDSSLNPTHPQALTRAFQEVFSAGYTAGREPRDAEVARLRAALEAIEGLEWLVGLGDIARAALSEQETP